MTLSTFLQWRAQFEVFLIGYDLLDYVNGILPCSSPIGTSSIDLNKIYWVWQDKLILSTILTCTSLTITSFIATTKTFHEAWKKLNTLYASRSRTQAMQLIEELTLIQCGNRSISYFLHIMKTLVNRLTIINHPI